MPKKAAKSPNKPKERFRKVDAKIAADMMQLICERFPDARCELNYKDAFELLISTIMSAQTTDQQVNKVNKLLFKEFPTARALANADEERVKQIIRPTGYYNAKARNIQACAKALVEKFHSKVPTTIEQLTSLPGVGRKTANVVLGEFYGQPAWTVDTHVQRLVKRMGFTKEEDPVRIEFALQKLFPDKDWSNYSISLIWHGRRICDARKPNCPECPVKHLCPSSQV